MEKVMKCIHALFSLSGGRKRRVGKEEAVKLGFAKKERPKEDITRDRESNSKTLLAGLAVTTALLGGIAYASLKVAEVFKGDDDGEAEDEEE